MYVGASIDEGETVCIDFNATDADNDELIYGFDILDGAVISGNKVSFTPSYSGEFFFRVWVNDLYHSTTVKNTVKVNVNGVIKVEIDGRPLKTDVSPYIVNGTALLPIRAIGERLGAEVSYDEHTETAMIEKDGVQLKITKNSKTAELNGRNVTLDEPAVISQGRFMVPLKFVSELLNCGVEWVETKKLVKIETK